MPISIYGENNPDLINFMPDRNATIWRYMDIGKYLDVITRGRLWFNRVIEFRKTDPYEGALTRYDQAKIGGILDATSKDELKARLSEFGLEGFVGMMDSLPEKSHHFFQLLFITKVPLVEHNAYTNSVSCWHVNATESDAMWSLYAQRDAGIAIKSSIPRVLKAFERAKRNLAIAKVRYDDGRLSALTSGIYDSVLVKRPAFTHENEVRIITSTPDGYERLEWTEENRVYNIDPNRPVPPGIYIDCNLDALVEEVVISPLMAQHIYQALETISKTFLPSAPIRKSTLLTREDIPLRGSPELSVMWNEFLKTKRVLDINEITTEPDKG